jgi:hypothetical protein
MAGWTHFTQRSISSGTDAGKRWSEGVYSTMADRLTQEALASLDRVIVDRATGMVASKPGDAIIEEKR